MGTTTPWSVVKTFLGEDTFFCFLSIALPDEVTASSSALGVISSMSGCVSLLGLEAGLMVVSFPQHTSSMVVVVVVVVVVAFRSCFWHKLQGHGLCSHVFPYIMYAESVQYGAYGRKGNGVLNLGTGPILKSWSFFSYWSFSQVYRRFVPNMARTSKKKQVTSKIVVGLNARRTKKK